MRVLHDILMCLKFTVIRCVIPMLFTGAYFHKCNTMNPLQQVKQKLPSPLNSLPYLLLSYPTTTNIFFWSLVFRIFTPLFNVLFFVQFSALLAFILGSRGFPGVWWTVLFGEWIMLKLLLLSLSPLINSCLGIVLNFDWPFEFMPNQ